MTATRSFRILLLAPFFFFAAVPQQPREAEKDTTAILQANYLYNIAKLVEWKDADMRNGNFVIGVMGSANLYQELIKQYSTRTIGKQPIEVRKLPRSAEVERCHMLFVGRSDLGLLPEIYKRMSGKPTLVVTEYTGALEDGAVVNFVKVDNLLKYEMSIGNAQKHGLVVGLTLKNLAHRVEE
ncbi:MAG: YfiR family protein [Flavobacteriales bacterium]|nr:YfiR family protein [Flavobacteriales bacterium]MCB9178758.1 YfiR family protein [Flavobacteriales bacterium]HPF89083.1 YfiR family protein [Flavobacteriales bacterium]